MINFATYATFEFTDKVFLLFQSINKYKNSNLHLLCLDDTIFNYFKKYKLQNLYIYNYKTLNIILDKDFAKNLSIQRFYFVKYLFNLKKIKSIHLLDSDIYFFSNPSQLKKIFKNYDIGFCRHNYSKNITELNNKYGVYNAGYIYLRNCYNSIKFLEYYISLCKKNVDYNYNDNVEKQNFADQTYLETLVLRFQKIKLLDDPGVNTGPWNVSNYKINIKKNFIYLNDLKLIFYHFSGVKKIFTNFYSLGLRMFVDNKYDIKKDIYMSYIKELIKINKKIKLNQNKKYLLHSKGSKIKALLSILYNSDYLYLTS
jgi:hypothetical protein